MKKLLILAILALPFMLSPSFADEPKERSDVRFE